MKQVKFNAKELIFVLTQLSKVKPSKILHETNNFRLKSHLSDKALILINNLNIELSCKLNCEFIESFDFLLPIDSLKVISKVESENIIIDFSNDNKIVIIDNKDKFKYGIDDVDTYPQFNISFNSLSNILYNSCFKYFRDLYKFTSAEDLRLALNGIFLDTANNSLVATDCHRLLKVDLLENDAKIKNDIPTLLNNETIETLLKFDSKNIVNTRFIIFKSEAKEHDLIVFDANDIEFELIQRSNISNTCKFPEYKNVIPEDNNKHFTVNSKELIKQLNKSLLFANKCTNAAIFEFKKDLLYLSSKEQDLDREFNTTLDIIGQSEIKISFNIKLLLDILYLDKFSKSITFELDRNNRVMITKQDNYLALLMPLMIND